MKDAAAFRGPGPLRSRIVAAAAALALAFGLGAAVLWFGGSIEAETLPGFAVDTGWTPWLLPATRLAMELAAVGTIGFLLAAVFLVPGRGAPAGASAELVLSPTGLRWVRAASWSAAAWTLSAVAGVCFTLSDLVGLPVGEALTGSDAPRVALSVESTRVLVAVAALSAVVAVAARLVTATGAAALTLGIALLAMAPPAFTGHAAAANNHQLATSTMLLHIIAAVLWTGGLLALLVARRRPVAALAATTRRFSRLAFWCFVAVGVSGLVNALARVSAWQDLFGSAYGLVVTAKTAALIGLGCFGAWHRRVSIPALAAGRRGAFARIGWVEVLLMAATIGLAAGLSRTAPPDEARAGLSESPVLELLGWVPEPLFVTAALAGIGCYLAGVRRLTQAGETWPAGRTAAWIGGWLVVAAATDLELSRWGHQLFTLIQAVQHFAFIAIAPVLLVSGGGVALARRALRPATERGMRGPREWLAVVADSGLAKALGQPVAALILYAGALYGMYASWASELVLRSHAAHVGTFGVALAAGCLFFRPLFGAERPEGRAPLHRQASFTLLLSGLALQAILGVAILRDIPLRTVAIAGAAVVAILGVALQLSVRMAGELRLDPGRAAGGGVEAASPGGPNAVPRQRSPERTGPRTGP